jgi:hypothetical protein
LPYLLSLVLASFQWVYSVVTDYSWCIARTTPLQGDLGLRASEEGFLLASTPFPGCGVGFWGDMFPPFLIYLFETGSCYVAQAGLNAHPVSASQVLGTQVCSLGLFFSQSLKSFRENELSACFMEQKVSAGGKLL